MTNPEKMIIPDSIRTNCHKGHESPYPNIITTTFPHAHEIQAHIQYVLSIPLGGRG